MPTSTQQSHQETKREIRMRKRPLLKDTADSQYLEPQYDTVLNLGAQSEDDYEVESVNGHEPRKTGRIIAHPRPPTGKAPTPSIRGPPRPGSPRPNKKLENKMYRWMISEDELTKHPQWLASGRVVKNDGSLSMTTTTNVRKRKALRVSNGQAAAGPSAKGKQARLTLQTRENALKEELGELEYKDLLDD
ncbi:hypothetical protein FRC08_005755 [Ceratobasidium sp. 394]|nr:hypothetical protein FRC08_005755 [Ceratobasidium sp. 394]